MNAKRSAALLCALLLTGNSWGSCLADEGNNYKELLAKGTRKAEVRDLYLKYEAEVLKCSSVVKPGIIDQLAGGSDYRQSFLLACLSNGWSVRADDVDIKNLPPSGTWAYSEENYQGLVRQFPSDCKEIHCMDVASFMAFPVNSLRIGSEVCAKLYSKEGFGGTSWPMEDSCPSFSIHPHSLRLRNPPRIDYVTISDYQSKDGRASFRLHVSGANIDDGSVLCLNQTQVDSTIELRLDNSSWLELGKDSAEAGYNLDPTYFKFPVFHYDSISAGQQDIAIGTEISVQVHGSLCQISNALTYVVPSPDKLDSDGDGLLDSWETGSVDGLNLVELGADPYRKDVYVEVDRMVVPGRIWSDFSETDYPRQATFEESIRSYASAPIINPDLSVGVALHVDYGQRQFEQAAVAEGGTRIPWKPFLGYKRSADFRKKHPGYYDVDELRSNPKYFCQSRARVFRYCVFGDQQWSSRSTGGGNGQSAFFVTLGVCRMNAVNLNYQTGVFLHELGHMFGLKHQGSGRGFNYKPNFNSLMNYKFVFQGRDIDGKLGDGRRKDGSGEQVYSYSEGMRATLDEGALNEVLGVANHFPHDWDQDEIIESKPVSCDISQHRKKDERRVLNDFADWANMDFGGLGESAPNLVAHAAHDCLGESGSENVGGADPERGADSDTKVVVHAASEHVADQDLKVVARVAPKRLTERKINGIAKVPRGAHFGLMCEVDGIIQTGHWKVKGEVIKHKPGKIFFKTEEFRVGDKVRTKAMKGHLAYALPGNQKMQISEGSPITILHDNSSGRNQLERNIHISSSNQLVLATARSGDSVPQSANRAELLCQSPLGGRIHFYWSNPSDSDCKQERKRKKAPEISAPIKCKCHGDTDPFSIEKALGSVQLIQLGGERYSFRVLDTKSGQSNESDHGVSASSIDVAATYAGEPEHEDCYGGAYLLLKEP